MWVLALDTTTRDGSVAVVRDDEVVVARPGAAGFSHAERVPSDLRDVLEAAGLTLADVDLLAVASGPGAFTGLRIGLAAMQGLAVATGRPVIGVPVLEAWAWALLSANDTTTAGAWLDASRGEVFAAAYAVDRTMSDPPYPLTEIASATAAPADVTIDAWRGVVPTATPVAVSGTPTWTADLAAAGYTPAPAAPLAAVVGRLAVRAYRAGATGSPAALVPVYVRRPDVEIDRDRRRAAAPPA